MQNPALPFQAQTPPTAALAPTLAPKSTVDLPHSETANDHLDTRHVSAKAGNTAEQVRQKVLEQGRADWELVCVVEDDGCLLGTLSAAELLALPNAAVLGAAMHRGQARIRADTDQEKMASMALQQGVSAMPVVDAAGHLIGVVGSVALMAILRREHVEDLHRLAGVTRESDSARNALEDPPVRSARHRLPWLVVGLGGSIVATFIVARFETALAAKPSLAFFVPGLVYLADAIGTQSEAVAVRGLSLTRVGIGRLIGNELRTGLSIGTVLALLALSMVWLAFGELRLAAAVALALAGASIVASVLGWSCRGCWPASAPTRPMAAAHWRRSCRMC